MRGKEVQTQGGFTLVELMIAVVVSSILASAIGMLLVSANRALIRNSRAVEMQRDVSLAMQIIGENIREGYSDLGQITKSTSGNSTTLYFDIDKSNRIVCNTTDNTLLKQPGNMTVISDEWDIVTFSAVRDITYGSWDIILEVRDLQSSAYIYMEANFYPRNKIPISR